MTIETLGRREPIRAPSLPPAKRLILWAAPFVRPLSVVSLLGVLDAVPAIGFAAGMAGAIGAAAAHDGWIWPWLALVGASLALRALLAQRATAAGIRVATKVKAAVRHGVLARLFDGGSTTEGVSAAVEGVEALDGYFARFSALKVSAAIVPPILIGAASLASPIGAALLLATFFVFIAGMVWAGRAAADEGRRQFQALQSLSGLFLDRLRGLPVLGAFQAEAGARDEIERASALVERSASRVLRKAFLSSAVLELSASVSVALVAVYCGLNLLRRPPFEGFETLSLTAAFFVLALAPEVYAPLRRLAAAYHDRQMAEAAVPALEAASCDWPASRSVDPLWTEPPGIQFRGVAIRYGTDTPAVTAFDLRVAPGEVVVITGASGSGKSSLLHLLLGLAPLSDGAVEIGGRSLPRLHGFAGALGWASQAPIVFPGTLGENIAVARRDAAAEDIRSAADQVGLHDLERPLDERGGGLSGGERRRLGLARALLSRSKVLLLDEPTAHLDEVAEAELLGVLRPAMRGRTILIATHSPAVLALADRVVRL